LANERSSGADFDPVSAEVWGPKEIQLTSGESTSVPAKVLTTRIKSPRGLFVSERENLGHAFAVGDMAIAIRNEGGGAKLSSAMWIMHRGVRYEIKGVLRSDYTTGVTTYQVTASNDRSTFIQ
jgi:hypothetical protein